MEEDECFVVGGTNKAYCITIENWIPGIDKEPIRNPVGDAQKLADVLAKYLPALTFAELARILNEE